MPPKPSQKCFLNISFTVIATENELWSSLTENERKNDLKTHPFSVNFKNNNKGSWEKESYCYKK